MQYFICQACVTSESCSHFTPIYPIFCGMTCKCGKQILNDSSRMLVPGQCCGVPYLIIKMLPKNFRVLSDLLTLNDVKPSVKSSRVTNGKFEICDNCYGHGGIKCLTKGCINGLVISTLGLSLVTNQCSCDTGYTKKCLKCCGKKLLACYDDIKQVEQFDYQPLSSDIHTFLSQDIKPLLMRF